VLADMANTNNTLDATIADVEKIDELLSHPEVSNFFVHTMLNMEKKRKVVDDG